MEFKVGGWVWPNIKIEIEMVGRIMLFLLNDLHTYNVSKRKLKIIFKLKKF